MTKKSLASVLKFQWWLHTSLTSVFFIALTFFFLFSVEDYFLEKQLIEISNLIAVNPAIKGLPNYIKIYSATEAPNVWVTELDRVAMNVAIEINSPQGHAIHILRSKFTTNQEAFILALDTIKTNSIGSVFDKLLMFILPWIIIFLALASFLAKRFIRQLQSHFNGLLLTIEKNQSPEAVEKFAEAQAINELALFAQLFAQVWQQKIEILSREKQGLEYLSHELRTPIQSSLATLELLALKSQDKTTIERLTRSLKRMTRLSNAILHLMESEQLLPTYPVDVINICQQLLEELTPLAEAKNQTLTLISLDKTTPLNVIATQEVIETLLSILLTNALQHSDSSPIIITVSAKEIRIENQIESTLTRQVLASAEKNHQGFGIGLTIAKRLANKFNLQLDVCFNKHQQVVATITNK